MMLEQLAPKAQAVIGGITSSTGILWWAGLLQGIGAVASTLAAVCGAIIAVHGVHRIFRPKRRTRS